MYLPSICFHFVDRQNFTFPSALNRKYSVTLSHTHTIVFFSTFMEEDKTELVFMYCRNFSRLSKQPDHVTCGNIGLIHANYPPPLI